jgi:hypothetical protein
MGNRGGPKRESQLAATPQTSSSMKYLLLLIAVAGTAFGERRLSEWEDARVNQLYPYVFERMEPNGLDPKRSQGLSDQDRDLLIRWIQAGNRRRRENGHRESELMTSGDLAILGDEWGIRVEMENVRKGVERGASGADIFRQIANGKTIPLVGDLLFKNENWTTIDDVMLAPAQETIAIGVIQTLKYSSQFLPDVSQWALQLDDAWAKPGGDVINILREWYRANEDKLRAGQFFDIRPGRTPTPHPTPEAPLAANSGKGSSVREDGPVTTAVAVNPTAPTTAPAWVLWTVAGVCVALAGVSIWYRKFRRGG